MKHALMLTAVTAAAIVLAGCSDEASTDASSPGSTSSESTTGATGSSTPASGDHNDADVMFAQLMLPHHEQAVEMSDLVLLKEDVDQDVVALAEQITAAQGPEISQMRGWLEGWDAEMEMSDDMGGMDHSMNGMMTTEDLAELESAEGDDASRLFLEQMTEHHTGAVEMAQSEVDDGLNPEALELARTIIDTQQAEIDEMADLLAAL